MLENLEIYEEYLRGGLLENSSNKTYDKILSPIKMAAKKTLSLKADEKKKDTGWYKEVRDKLDENIQFKR